MKNPYSVERYLGLPSQQILELHLQLNPYFYINDKIFEGPLVQKIYKDNINVNFGPNFEYDIPQGYKPWCYNPYTQLYKRKKNIFSNIIIIICVTIKSN